ncbi:MAG: hypothetical protein M1118_06490 [Chloroflexi bacterium]|nr:hypothetical protein [Chloroflexota bacterium]
MGRVANSRRRKPPLLFPARYALCYALFLVLVAIAYGDFLAWRITSVYVVVIFAGANSATALLSAVLTIILAFALFAALLWAEAYLRDGVQRFQLIPRFVYVALPLLGVLGVGLALQELFQALVL